MGVDRHAGTKTLQGVLLFTLIYHPLRLVNSFRVLMTTTIMMMMAASP